jgi:hypothetical protein
MRHTRWHSARRRFLVDSHDLRFGLFWVKDHSAWLHLPGLIIQIKGEPKHEDY